MYHNNVYIIVYYIVYYVLIKYTYSEQMDHSDREKQKQYSLRIVDFHGQQSPK